MKKLIVTASTVVCMIGLGLALGNAWGQGTATKAAPPDNTPHKVGLIDMAFLFSKYEKFDALRADLKAEIESADAAFKVRFEKVKILQAEMKELTPNQKDYIDREKQITDIVAAAEGEKKNMQRKFMRDETKIYQQIYKEVQDAVTKYSELKGYTLIVRYSRDEAAAGDDPQKVMASLQRQVVYSRQQDDITEKVLTYLNRSYKPAGTTPRISNKTPAGAAKGTSTN